jgi:UDP-GlcNAc3NAcA epimerase
MSLANIQRREPLYCCGRRDTDGCDSGWFMKIASLVDSYSDFIQAATVSRVLRRNHREILVHAGPHDGFFQARTYFEHLELAEPEVNLELGAGTSGVSLGVLLARVERVLLDLRPDLVIVRGNSPTALAGALAAARQSIPVARLDAGVRAYHKRLPEELNNVLADRLADVLFCNTRAAVLRLAEEGIVSGVHFTGDIALDTVEYYRPLARLHSTILQRVGLYRGYYVLAVVQHIDQAAHPDYLFKLVKALNSIREPIIFPLSDQARVALAQANLTLAPHVLPIDPIGYLDMLSLVEHARAIVTDVERLQREAYLLGVPCITVSEETDLPETRLMGWNELVGTHPDRIIAAVRDFLPPVERPPVFGDGHAAERIGEILATQPIEFGGNYTRVAADLLPQLYTV